MLSERVKEIYQEIEQFEVVTKEQLEQYRQRFVGRKGAVEALFEGLKEIVKEERRAVGQGLMHLKIMPTTAFWPFRLILRQMTTVQGRRRLT